MRQRDLTFRKASKLIRKWASIVFCCKRRLSLLARMLSSIYKVEAPIRLRLQASSVYRLNVYCFCSKAHSIARGVPCFRRNNRIRIRFVLVSACLQPCPVGSLRENFGTDFTRSHTVPETSRRSVEAKGILALVRHGAASRIRSAKISVAFEENAIAKGSLIFWTKY